MAKGRIGTALQHDGFHPRSARCALLLHRLSFGDYAHNLGLGYNLSVDLCFAAHALNPRTYPERRYLEHKRIAGHYRTTEPRAVDSAEQGNPAVSVFDLS